MEEVCVESFYKENIVLLFKKKKIIFYVIVSEMPGFLIYTRQRECEA